MVDVVMDADSVSCVACGSRCVEPGELRVIKFSRDGKNFSCSGSLCRNCRLELVSALVLDMRDEGREVN